MCDEKEILKLIKASDLQSIPHKIENVFEKDLTTMDKQAILVQKAVIENWMHALTVTVVTIVPEVKISHDLTVVFRIFQICSQRLNDILNHIPVDKKHIVPNLICRVLHGNVNQEHFGQQLELCDLALQMVSHESLDLSKSEKGKYVAEYCYAAFWNGATRIFKTVETVEEYCQLLHARHLSIMCALRLPEKWAKVSEFVSCTCKHYASTATDFPHVNDDSVLTAFYKLFTECTRCLNNLYKDNKKESVKTQLATMVLQVHVSFLQASLKLSHFHKISEIMFSLRLFSGLTYMAGLEQVIDMTVFLTKLTAGDTRDLNEGAKLASILCSKLDSFEQSSDVNYVENVQFSHCIILMIQACSNISNRLGKDTWFAQSLCKVFQSVQKVTKAYPVSESSMSLDDATTVATMKFRVYARILQLTAYIVKETTMASKEESQAAKDLIAASEDYITTLKETQAVPMLKETTKSYAAFLLDSLLLPAMRTLRSKALYSHLHAITKATFDLLPIGGQKVEVYDLHIESHQHGHSFMLGTAAVVRGLAEDPSFLHPIAMAWAKLKREAIGAQQDIFQTMTLACVVKESGRTVPHLTYPDMLLAEYQCWKIFSKRRFDVEFHILVKLIDCDLQKEQRGIILMELVNCMMMTGLTLPDKSLQDVVEECLALFKDQHLLFEGHCYYLKYLIDHYERMQVAQESTTKKDVTSGALQDVTTATCELQPEMTYISRLEHAINQWEKGLAEIYQKGNVTVPADTAMTDFNSLIPPAAHCDIMIQCGVRLNIMLQPKLALRALTLAQKVVCTLVVDKKLPEVQLQNKKTMIVTEMVHALVAMGRYSDAETAIKSLVSTDTYITLMTAYLQIYMDKESAVKTLTKILSREKSNNVSHLLYEGIANRLMSVCLCVSDRRDWEVPSKYHLLTLAYDAVHCHISVLNYVLIYQKGMSQIDAWIYLYEFLQSVYHLCQLYRSVGMPREAICYLNIGYRAAHYQNLPSWSCQFLCEMLRMHGMQANVNKAFNVLDAIHLTFNLKNKFTEGKDTLNAGLTSSEETNNKSSNSEPDRGKLENENKQDNWDNNKLDVGNCIGVEEKITPSKFMEQEKTDGNKTPERVGHCTVLNSDKKRQLEVLAVPECPCLKVGAPSYSDTCMHKMSLLMGVAMAEFLMDSGSHDAVRKTLHHLHTSLDVFRDHSFLKPSQYFSRSPKQKKMMIEQSLFKHHPDVLATCLTASCVKAELNLIEKDYESVNSMYQMVKDFEEGGMLKNLVHGTILVSRLALSRSAAFFLTSTDLFKDSYQTLLETEMEMEAMMLSQKGNTGFTAEGCADLKKTGVAKNILKDLQLAVPTTADIKATPMKSKSKFDALCTPKMPSLEKGMLSTTKRPALMNQINNNRIAELQKLIDSDEDDDIVFPKTKPITPSVAKSVRKRKPQTDIVSRTVSSITKMTAEDQQNAKLACKLFIFEDDNSSVDKKNNVTKGQDIICASSSTKKSNQSKGRTKKAETEKSCKQVSPIVIDISGDEENLNYPPPISVLKANNRMKSTKKEHQNCKAETVDSEDLFNKESLETELGKKCNPTKSVKAIRKRSVYKEGNTTIIESSEAMEIIDVSNEITGTDSKVDVYDFLLEASPVVKNNTVGNKTKTGRSTRKTKTKTDVTINKDTMILTDVIDNSLNVPEGTRKKERAIKVRSTRKTDNKENVETVKDEQNKSKTRPVRGKRKIEEIEAVRFGYENVGDLSAELTFNKLEEVNTVLNGELNEDFNESEMNYTDDSSEIDDDFDETFGAKEPCVGMGLDLLCDNFETSLVIIEPVPEVLPVEFYRVNKEHGNGLAADLVEASNVFIDCNACVQIQSEHDCSNVSEPMEIMRGDVKPTRRTTRRGKKATASGNGGEKEEEEKTGTEETDDGIKNTTVEGAIVIPETIVRDVDCGEVESTLEGDRGMETMRGGRLYSIQDKMGLLDEPDIAVADTVSSRTDLTAGEDIFEHLHDLYKRLCKLPPSPQHAEVCYALALRYAGTDQTKAAFYLSDGVAITFRHQLRLNIARKLRKMPDAKPATIQLWNKTLDDIFNPDMTHFQTIIDAIPEEWAVVQISVVNVAKSWKQMIITRFSKGAQPIVVKIPAFNTLEGVHMAEDFDSLMTRVHDNTEVSCRLTWWTKRQSLDMDCMKLLQKMERIWLKNWRCLLYPPEISAASVDEALKTCREVFGLSLDVGVVKLLLVAIRILSEEEMSGCCKALLPSNTDVEEFVRTFQKYRDGVVNFTAHTVLILDKSVQNMPWESMPMLSTKSVTRMPCLSHVYTQLEQQRTTVDSLLTRGINMRSTCYLLNPGNDIPNTEAFFKDWFEKEKGWTGLIGKRPPSNEFMNLLTSKDFFLYCGHGSGGQFFPSDELERLQGRAVTMLMGCSSGRMLVKGQLEPSGMMNSYFLAGCPMMIANLWDVTDKDIDKYTQDCLERALRAPRGSYLTLAVQEARKVCKMKHINGCAVVVYGLPLHIDNRD
ncbi:uncharacterized protein LOC127863473 isoform X2 [Dreissena polymorpha]|uniref:uncharacterized protein LOC127863473 isoform X2 n=1 Tax=Dreissena polymorpha TaxID=45954 RepID=UPI0022653C3A|nr:uncharacterized protein LOC127863473 isoform X2 [Dreissena polymorpha]